MSDITPPLCKACGTTDPEAFAPYNHSTCVECRKIRERERKAARQSRPAAQAPGVRAPTEPEIRKIRQARPIEVDLDFWSMRHYGEPVPLEGLIKHAQRFGVESVYEAAEDWLTLSDLVILVTELRKIVLENPKEKYHTPKTWNPEKKPRRRLVRRLIEAGYDNDAIHAITGEQVVYIRKIRELEEEE